MINLLYNTFSNHLYLNLPECKNNILYCPLNVDTEFYNLHFTDDNYRENPSPTLTVQVSDIDHKVEKIYTHPDSITIGRHEIFTHQFIGTQYLINNGYNLLVTDNHNKISTRLPTMVFDLYCHFAIAEVMRIFTERIREDVKKLIIYPKKNRGSAIKQGNRTRTQYTYGFNHKDYSFLPYLIHYNGISYQLAIRICDSIGTLGNQSYANLAKLVNTELKYKTTITKPQLENMKDTYIEDPQLFDNYSLGDLWTYTNILGAKDLLDRVTKEIGIESSLKMTIGSTAAALLFNTLSHRLGIKDSKRLKGLLKLANGDYLRKTKDSRVLLSKVDGGRCFNNRPLDFKIDKEVYNDIKSLVTGRNSLVDIDISGAYGKGLSVQDYPIGNPRTLQSRLDTVNEKELTLRMFLDKYGDELVDGLWMMRVSSKGKLKYPQDLIPSWVIGKSQLANIDSLEDGGDSYNYTKTGYLKIFSNEIIYGCITSDILDLINNIASKFQRNELMDNLLVNNASWYSKHHYCDSIDEVLDKHSNYKGVSSSEWVDDELTNKVNYCQAWTKLRLGDLLINPLLNKRGEYQKLSEDKNLSEDERSKYDNLQTFYKLLINTTYGVIVSPYFDIGNTVVGNNITARCRCMAWYMEKGLNSFQTITDGSVFELDKVVFPVGDRRLTMSNTVRGYSKSVSEKNWTTKPLVITAKYFTTTNFVKSDRDIVDRFLKLTGIVDEDGNDHHKHFYDGGINNILEDMIVEDFTNNDRSKVIEKYELFMSEIMDNYSVTYSIEDDVLNHLRTLFPKVKVLHQEILHPDNVMRKGYFTLKIKNIAGSGRFHGNANYKLGDLRNIDDINNFVVEDDKYKMRGYRNDRTYDFIDEDDISNEDFYDNLPVTVDCDDVNIPKKFLDGLDEVMSVQKPFIQTAIIKINEYRNNYESKYINTNHIVGGQLYIVRLLRELSIGQFLYPDRATFEKINKKHTKQKENYGYGYEGLYLDSDSYKLHYGALIRDMDRCIVGGVTKRLKPIEHPYYSNLIKVREIIKNSADTRNDEGLDFEVLNKIETHPT